MIINKNVLFPLFVKILVLTFFVNLISCGNNDYVPKPRSYFRIDLPQKKYILFDSVYPYAFEYPCYSNIEPYTGHSTEKYWINIIFPSYKAEIHISYKKINNNLDTLLQDADELVNKHIPKANDIRFEKVLRDSANVYGLIYEISGTGVASPYQFYLTDSTTNYLRGALYFRLTPNNDSLAPVIDFIKKDIQHIINTFKWKN